MASIWKDTRTTHFVACFTAITGMRRVQWKRSTHTADRKQARRIADEIEDAAHGRADASRVRDFLNSIADLSTRRGLHHVFDKVMRKTTGTGLGGKGTRAFLDAWLARTQSEVAPATFTKYQRVAKVFLESLGGQAEQDIALIKRDDITRFRDSEAKRSSASTGNGYLKVVRVFFNAAEADGLLVRNEARLVKLLKTKDGGTERRAFTIPELKRVLAVANNEWRSMVLVGLYTGARLGDLAQLTWRAVDLEQGEIRFATRKTGRPMVIPIARPLQAHLEKLPAGDDPNQPLHPRAFRIMKDQQRSGSLSNQFAAILASAGITESRTHAAKPKGKGRAARRAASEITFHSLRHTATSLLKSAGVSDSIAMDIIGHESAEMSRLYTHIGDEAKRDAVNKIPDVLSNLPTRHTRGRAGEIRGK
jgi:integrase